MKVLSFFILLFLSFSLLYFTHTSVTAQVMQSTNYRLESDSLNVGGGLSTSSSYSLESTTGEIATGESTSTSYALKAGYQQMHEVYLSLTGASAVTMTPAIPGVSGGTANGSTTVTVTTDSLSGYSLAIHSSQSPSMEKGVDTIDDYVPVGAVPDYSFLTDPPDAHFGYTPAGVDVTGRYLDDGASVCGGGGTSEGTLTCWDGLSMTERIIASRTSSTHPSGVTTTVYFRVEVGGSVAQPPGTYIATTTLTALPL